MPAAFRWPQNKTLLTTASAAGAAVAQAARRPPLPPQPPAPAAQWRTREEDGQPPQKSSRWSSNKQGEVAESPSKSEDGRAQRKLPKQPARPPSDQEIMEAILGEWRGGRDGSTYSVRFQEQRADLGQCLTVSTRRWNGKRQVTKNLIRVKDGQATFGKKFNLDTGIISSTELRWRPHGATEGSRNDFTWTRLPSSSEKANGSTCDQSPAEKELVIEEEELSEHEEARCPSAPLDEAEEQEELLEEEELESVCISDPPSLSAENNEAAGVDEECVRDEESVKEDDEADDIVQDEEDVQEGDLKDEEEDEQRNWSEAVEAHAAEVEGGDGKHHDTGGETRSIPSGVQPADLFHMLETLREEAGRLGDLEELDLTIDPRFESWRKLFPEEDRHRVYKFFFSEHRTASDFWGSPQWYYAGLFEGDSRILLRSLPGGTCPPIFETGARLVYGVGTRSLVEPLTGMDVLWAFGELARALVQSSDWGSALACDEVLRFLDAENPAVGEHCREGFELEASGEMTEAEARFRQVGADLGIQFTERHHWELSPVVKEQWISHLNGNCPERVWCRPHAEYSFVKAFQQDLHVLLERGEENATSSTKALADMLAEMEVSYPNAYKCHRQLAHVLRDADVEETARWERGHAEVVEVRIKTEDVRVIGRYATQEACFQDAARGLRRLHMGEKDAGFEDGALEDSVRAFVRPPAGSEDPLSSPDFMLDVVRYGGAYYSLATRTLVCLREALRCSQNEGLVQRVEALKMVRARAHPLHHLCKWSDVSEEMHTGSTSVLWKFYDTLALAPAQSVAAAPPPPPPPPPKPTRTPPPPPPAPGAAIPAAARAVAASAAPATEVAVSAGAGSVPMAATQRSLPKPPMKVIKAPLPQPPGVGVTGAAAGPGGVPGRGATSVSASLKGEEAFWISLTPGAAPVVCIVRQEGGFLEPLLPNAADLMEAALEGDAWGVQIQDSDSTPRPVRNNIREAVQKRGSSLLDGPEMGFLMGVSTKYQAIGVADNKFDRLRAVHLALALTASCWQSEKEAPPGTSHRYSHLVNGLRSTMPRES